MAIGGFYACDSTTSPKNIFQESPVISSFNISPQNVHFTALQDGIKDTTVQVSFYVNTLHTTSDQKPTLTLTNRSTGIIEVEKQMSPTDTDQAFKLKIPFQTKTTLFKEYNVSVVIQDEEGNYNYARSSLTIKGFSIAPPVILKVNNPTSVQRPASGERLYPFTAKVTDAQGQEIIEGVFVRIFNPKTGEVSSSPFRLFDNGEDGDDVVANDSVYTVTFPVNSSSKLQTFDLHYYAINKGGLTSDTVKTTFSIVE
jgi:hypothetical protein